MGRGAGGLLAEVAEVRRASAAATAAAAGCIAAATDCAVVLLLCTAAAVRGVPMLLLRCVWGMISSDSGRGLP